MALQDISLWMLFSVLFGILLISFIYAYNEVSGEMISVFGEGHQASSFMTSISDVYGYLDYVLLFSYVSFLVGSFVLSWFVRTHPVFFIFFMLGCLGLTFVSFIYKNVYLEFISVNSSFQSIYDQFVLTKIFMENLPLIILITSVAIAVIQYSKIGRTRLRYY